MMPFQGDYFALFQPGVATILVATPWLVVSRPFRAQTKESNFLNLFLLKEQF